MDARVESLSPSLLEQPVRGRHLEGPTLGDNLRPPTLLVFLRHFG